MDFINLDRQYSKYADAIDPKIKSVLTSGKFIQGNAVSELEQVLAGYVGTDHGIACSSGTDALLLSLLSLEMPPKSEVITTPFSFVSTAEVILRAGAVPVFVDIDLHSYNMDADHLEKAINEKTKAILPASLFGYTGDFNRINKIAEQHKIPVIEDGCQSFGSRCTQTQSLSCGQSTLGCTSFFPTKPLGCYGDGGMIFTNDPSLAKTIRQLKNHGLNSTGFCENLGMNSRLDTLQAAILLAKWPFFEEEIQARRQAARFYIQHLSHIPGIRFPSPDMVDHHVFAQFTIETGVRDALKAFLAKKNIPSAVYYSEPLHLQKPFLHLNYSKGTFPVAERISKRVLSLPLHPFITEEELETVFESIMEFMG